MSLLNYRDIRTFFTIFLLASIYCLPTVLGGICWSKMTSKGYCKAILKTGVSREDCCSETDSNTAYSTENLSSGALFFWRSLAEGVPCKPCKETCENLQCGRDKKCVIKKDRPTCICAPKCKHQKNIKKGPVCGTDGRSYKSVCRLKKRACRTKDQTLNINYYGLCQSSCQNVKCPSGKYCVQDQNLNAHCVDCNQFCKNRPPFNLRKVCGIDGVTYRSACHLQQESCFKSRSVSIAYEGRCKSNASCANIRCARGEKCLVSKSNNLPRCVSCSECPKWKSAATIRKEMGGPICGSNNQTYEAWCFMAEDSCRKGYVIETQFAGSCQIGNKSLELLDNSVMSKYG